MEISALYNTAKEYAEKIKNEKPNYASDADAAICLIVTDKQDIFTGVSSVAVSGGNIETVPAELSAVTAMKLAGQSAAKQMITVLFGDLSISKPSGVPVDLLLAADTGNGECQIVVSEQEAVAAASLKDDSSVPDQLASFFSGFGDVAGALAEFDTGFDNDIEEPASEVASDTEEAAEETSSEELGAPAEFASGISIDESNPFFEPAGSAAPQEVPTMDTSAEEEDDFDEPEEAKPAKKSKESKAEAKVVKSKEDILKQAKKRKKVAKANFNFRKKF